MNNPTLQLFFSCSAHRYGTVGTHQPSLAHQNGVAARPLRYLVVHNQNIKQVAHCHYVKGNPCGGWGERHPGLPIWRSSRQGTHKGVRCSKLKYDSDGLDSNANNNKHYDQLVIIYGLVMTGIATTVLVVITSHSCCGIPLGHTHRLLPDVGSIGRSLTFMWTLSRRCRTFHTS